MTAVPVRPQLGTRRKVLLSLATLGTATAVAVTGTYASFSASVSRGHQLTTGVPVLTLGTTGTAANRLGIDSVNLAPGESVYRAFDITNTGTTTFTSFTTMTEVTVSSILDTDAVNGLQVRLERCSTPWTESGTSPNFGYTCPGTRSTVLTSRPVALPTTPLSGMQSMAAGGTDHMLLVETLPLTADNTFVNKTTALTFTFNAA